jgi:hypothetical protein
MDMQEEYGNLCELLSTTGDWIVRLNSPDDEGNRQARGIFCQDKRDLGRIAGYVPELCMEDTPVYEMNKNNAIRKIGGLTKVITENRINRAIRVPTDISDMVAEEREERPVADSYSDISDRFDESAIYEQIFSSRDELGMSIDYFTKKDKQGNEKQDFRYRRSKVAGKRGRWVSGDYAREAISALHEYDKLVKKLDADSMVKALDIAAKYFTDEGFKKANEKLAKKSYNALVYKGDSDSLKKAKEISSKYFIGAEREKSESVLKLLTDVDNALKIPTAKRYEQKRFERPPKKVLVVPNHNLDKGYKEVEKQEEQQVRATPPLPKERPAKYQGKILYFLRESYVDASGQERVKSTLVPPPLPGRSAPENLVVRHADGTIKPYSQQLPPPLPESYLKKARQKKIKDSKIISLADHRRMQQEKMYGRVRSKTATRLVTPTWTEYRLPSQQENEGGKILSWDIPTPPPLPFREEYARAA